MQNSLYKLFEHKCVLEVCVQSSFTPDIWAAEDAED